MPNTVKKYKITQLQNDDSLLELHPETDADIVNVSKTGTNAYGGTATNVQAALKETYALAEAASGAAGVTGVKGNAESSYRTGQVNLTPANIGAEAAFTDGSATIASESGGVVTIKAGVKQTSGAIGNSTGSDITLGTAAKMTKTTTVDTNSTDAQAPSAKAVYTAINTAVTNLPTPMQFKGSLGTGGTATTLPAAAAGNNGWAYVVITAGTYGGKACDVGDLLISNGTEWVLVPSGDEPEGTVTSVGMTVPTGLQVSGSPITSSGTLAVTFADGYSIPTTANQTAWSNKQAQIPATGSTTKPVYFSAAGTVAEATTYAGGTKVTLNGTDRGGDSCNIYAPISGVSSTSSLYYSVYKPSTIPGQGGYQYVLADKLQVNESTIASHFKNAKTISLNGDVNGSAQGGNSVQGSNGDWFITTTLANSGVTAGTYSAVTVNAKGIVTAGAQFIEVGAEGQTSPSANLAVGGIFFQEI